MAIAKRGVRRKPHKRNYRKIPYFDFLGVFGDTITKLIELRMYATGQEWEEAASDFEVLMGDGNSDDATSNSVSEYGDQEKNELYSVSFWRSEDRVWMPNPYSIDTYIYNHTRQTF